MESTKFEKFEGKLVNGRLVYSTSQTLKIIEVNWATFRHWIEKNADEKNPYVRPDIPAEGPGTTNYFTKENLFRIALFKKLIGVGLKRFIASELANEVKLEWWADINYLKEPIYLLAVGKVPPKKDKENWRDSIEVKVALNNKIDLSDFEVVIAMNLNKIAENIDARVE
jgi:hypothetical protein